MNIINERKITCDIKNCNNFLFCFKWLLYILKIYYLMMTFYMTFLSFIYILNSII